LLGVFLDFGNSGILKQENQRTPITLTSWSTPVFY